MVAFTALLLNCKVILMLMGPLSVMVDVVKHIENEKHSQGTGLLADFQNKVHPLLQ